MIKILQGDCRDRMKDLEAESIDSVVTDPPYGLNFMDKDWDSDEAYQESSKRWAEEAKRVLKPGGHLLAFGGTRTYHRMVTGIEEAGFEIRDTIHWTYGSGFPKNHDVSKAIDKEKGKKDEREVVSRKVTDSGGYKNINEKNQEHDYRPNAYYEEEGNVIEETKGATDKAKRWDGWGTALKPSHELIVVARKPLAGTVAENVLEHGTGALNIEGCRTEVDPDDENIRENYENHNRSEGSIWENANGADKDFTGEEGRWPANVIIDEAEASQINWQSGVSENTRHMSYERGNGRFIDSVDDQKEKSWHKQEEGGAARFFKQISYHPLDAPESFYCPKPAKKEKNIGCEGKSKKVGHNQFDTCAKCGGYIFQNQDRDSACDCEDPEREDNVIEGNFHVTVKPVELMAYLIRLSTPPGGKVLDPFAGSGTTGVSALLENKECVMIESDEDYVGLCEARTEYAKENLLEVKKMIFGDPSNQITEEQAETEANHTFW